MSALAWGKGRMRRCAKRVCTHIHASRARRRTTTSHRRAKLMINMAFSHHTPPPPPLGSRQTRRKQKYTIQQSNTTLTRVSWKKISRKKQQQQKQEKYNIHIKPDRQATLGGVYMFFFCLCVRASVCWISLNSITRETIYACVCVCECGSLAQKTLRTNTNRKNRQESTKKGN